MKVKVVQSNTEENDIAFVAERLSSYCAFTHWFVRPHGGRITNDKEKKCRTQGLKD